MLLEVARELRAEGLPCPENVTACRRYGKAVAAAPSGPIDRHMSDPAVRSMVDGLAELLARLPEKEQQVINLRFFHGLTQSDCARILSVSQVQVSRLERRAMENLRAVML